MLGFDTESDSGGGWLQVPQHAPHVHKQQGMQRDWTREAGLGAGKERQGGWCRVRLEKMAENHLMQNFPLNKKGSILFSLDHIHFCSIITVRYRVWEFITHGLGNNDFSLF